MKNDIKIKKFFESLKRKKVIIVFTNGCFDILHRGHIDYLERAKGYGDFLIVGINSDRSIRALKGIKRPVIPMKERTEILSALRAVDAVIPFREDTPLRLIKMINPDLLVKGNDWGVNQIVGKDFVEQNGGTVKSIPLVPGKSTTAILKKIQKSREE